MKYNSIFQSISQYRGMSFLQLFPQIKDWSHSQNSSTFKYPESSFFRYKFNVIKELNSIINMYAIPRIKKIFPKFSKPYDRYDLSNSIDIKCRHTMVVYAESRWEFLISRSIIKITCFPFSARVNVYEPTKNDLIVTKTTDIFDNNHITLGDEGYSLNKSCNFVHENKFYRTLVF